MIKSYIDPVSLDYYGIVCITISNADFKELLGEYNFDIALYDEQQSFLFCSSKSATRSQLEDQKNYLSPQPRSGEIAETGLWSAIFPVPLHSATWMP